MSKQSRALVLLQVVIGGLRDSIRHVKYPDEERCARCGSKWPCPNGAVDELRIEIADLERQLAEAKERGKEAWKWAMFLRQYNNLTLVRERDEAQEKLDDLEGVRALADQLAMALDHILSKEGNDA